MSKAAAVWIISFFTSHMTITQYLKHLEKIAKWDKIFKKGETDKNFHGVEALALIKELVNPGDDLAFDPRVKLGRLANGFQSDHGTVIHAVCRLGSYCGTKPGGRRSVGWSEPEDSPVNCPKCLEKIKMVEKALAANQ